MNICSLVVHTRPEMLAAVRTSLTGLPGVEVHGGSDGGKLIVTVEDTQGSQAYDTITAIGEVEHVVNTVLIYHYGEDEPLEEEVISENH